MGKIKIGMLVVIATPRGSRYDGKVGLVINKAPLKEFPDLGFAQAPLASWRSQNLDNGFALSVLLGEEVLGFGYEEVRAYKEFEKEE